MAHDFFFFFFLISCAFETSKACLCKSESMLIFVTDLFNLFID